MKLENINVEISFNYDVFAIIADFDSEFLQFGIAKKTESFGRALSFSFWWGLQIFCDEVLVVLDSLVYRTDIFVV